MVKVYIDKRSGNAVVVPEGTEISAMTLSDEAKRILAGKPDEKTVDLKQHPICMEPNLDLVMHEIKTKGYFINVIGNNRSKA